MRVIIACAGPQVKWGNHLGAPSHFAPVRIREDGEEREPLLHRTLRQLARYTQEGDVFITCPPGDSRYYLGGARVYQTTGNSEFSSTRFLWSLDERTILLLGDVYFSDLAIRKIFGFREECYMSFGRYSGSNTTHTPYGELFAHSWWPSQHGSIDAHLQKVEQARAQGIKRPHGWMLLRSLESVPLNRHVVKPDWFTQIDDWTDDIDYPEDFERHPATKGYKP